MSTATSHTVAPVVSVGLPVYNGSALLEEAITSLLGQTFGDFEIVICDNASTDETADICSRFAARDPRVRYYRNKRNLGASPNFNRAFELARGQYFKWAAHDDLLEPTYLERCLEPLREDAGVVLCHSNTLVDDGTQRVPLRELRGLESSDIRERFASVALQPHWCQDVFGVYRTAALRKTGLHRSYYGSDKILVAEMALLGRFVRVPEPLFINRDHPGRSLRACNLLERHGFIDTQMAERRVIPNWNLFVDFCRIVGDHVKDRRDRYRCYGVMAKWWFVNRHWARLGLDLGCAAVPSLAPALHRWRARYHQESIGSGGSNPQGSGTSAENPSTASQAN